MPPIGWFSWLSFRDGMRVEREKREERKKKGKGRREEGKGKREKREGRRQGLCNAYCS
jgi:hypothetical protein